MKRNDGSISRTQFGEDVMNEHVNHYYAIMIARRNKCFGPVYRIHDKWGGYWQTTSPEGYAYSFRTVARGG
jgi:hypothetical protein